MLLLCFAGRLESKSLTHVVLILLAKSSGKTLERWSFNIGSKALASQAPTLSHAPSSVAQDLSIPNLLKQIASTASFLGDLPEPSVFNVLLYTAPHQALRDNHISSRLQGNEHDSMIGDIDSGTGLRDVTEEHGTYPFDEGVEVQQVCQAQVHIPVRCERRLIALARTDHAERHQDGSR